jgi:O-antigen/teichoic acid export membrane protein
MKLDQIKTGAILSYVNTFVGVFVGLLYVPLILKILSIEEYGLYQMVGAITAYLGLMDLRLATTTVRYYSQALATNNSRRQQEVLSTSLLIFLSMSALLILSGFPLMKLFSVVYASTLSQVQYREGIIMVWLGIAAFALTFPSHVFAAVINSHERFIFLRMFSIISTLIKPFLSYALLIMNPVAITLSAVQLILTFSLLVGYYLYDKGILKVNFTFHAFNWQLAKDMLKFSFFLILIAVVDQIYWEAGKLFLGAMVGTASVALFSFAVQITRYYVTISSSLNSLLFPRITKLVVEIEENVKELNRIFITYSRVQGIVLGLILSGFILFGKSFIGLWIGPEYEQVYYLTLSFMIPFTWDLTQNFGISVLNAINKHKYRAWLYSVVVLIYIVLCYPVIKYYGALGCAVLSGLCILLGNGFGLSILYSKIGRLKMRFYFYWMMRLLPIALVSLILGMLVRRFLPITSWFDLVLQGALFCIFYSIGIYFFYLSKNERIVTQTKIVSYLKHKE